MSISTKTRKSNNKGFSLIELLVIIAIIATLTASIAPAVIRYIEKARKAQILQIASMMYDQCTVSVAEFDYIEQNGNKYVLKDGMNKTDPVYGKVGRISNWSCYNVCIGKPITNKSKVNSYIDQVIAEDIVKSFSNFSANNYGKTSPNGKTIAQCNTLPDYAGRFCFICCYNEQGCVYVEVYYRGYFVHYDGTQKIEDVVNATQNPNVRFSDIN